MQVVRYHQRMRHAGLPVGLLLMQGAHLIECIERQKLNTGSGINGAAAQLMLRLLHQAVRARITIADRLTHLLTLCIQQHHINTPGVDADTVRDDAFII